MKERESLLELVHGFSGLRVLVLGDLMLDEYLSGSVNRISPEAPIPIVSLENRSSRPGGAANVAVNLKNLGAEVSLVGLVGNDESGQQLKKLLSEREIGVDTIVQTDRRRTTRKARVLSQGQQLLRVDTEDCETSYPEEQKSLSQQLETLIFNQRFDVLLFEDYDKGVLSPKLIQHALQLAKANKLPTVVDPKHRNFWEYKGVDLFKPNLAEVRGALQHTTAIETLAELSAIDQLIRKALGQTWTLITLGAAGAYIGGGEGVNQKAPAISKSVVDVCGAGDSVAAVVALALAQGASAHEMLQLSNIAGSLACSHVGVWPINRVELATSCKLFLKQNLS